MRPKPLEFVKDTGRDDDPMPVGWCRDGDMPTLMIPLKESIRQAVVQVPSLQSERPKVGILFKRWRGHGENCLVVANHDNPGTGDEFAVSKQPIYMRVQYDARAGEMLEANPSFKTNLLDSLRTDNCAEACFIEGTRDPSQKPALFLKCPDAKAGVFVREEDFGKAGIVQWAITQLRDTLR